MAHCTRRLSAQSLDHPLIHPHTVECLESRFLPGQGLQSGGHVARAILKARPHPGLRSRGGGITSSDRPSSRRTSSAAMASWVVAKVKTALSPDSSTKPQKVTTLAAPLMSSCRSGIRAHLADGQPVADPVEVDAGAAHVDGATHRRESRNPLKHGRIVEGQEDPPVGEGEGGRGLEPLVESCSRRIVPAVRLSRGRPRASPRGRSRG